MGIILLIFQILGSIPTMIRIVMFIIDIIKNMPKSERAEAYKNLKLHMLEAKASGKSDPLESFLKDIQAKKP